MSNPISDYMRDMQRKSAASRWAGLSAAERSAKMKAVHKAAKKRTTTPKAP